MKLKSQIESILLVSSRPIIITNLIEQFKVKKDKVMEILNELSTEYEEEARGIRLVINNNKVQMVSSPENTDLVQDYLKSDLTGELSKPSLETLTIIAYRQPVTKAEMEQIRGVNCSLILRNLNIRGLIEADYNKERGVTEYNVTLDFLKYLGIDSITKLPDYEKLNSDENLQKLLNSEYEQQEVEGDEIVKVEVKQE